MALIEVKVPQLSESVAEATLLQWKKKPGQRVEMDEILVEIETDKVVLEVPAPAAGVLAQIVKNDGDSCIAEEVIAKIDTEGQEVMSGDMQIKSIPSAEPTDRSCSVQGTGKGGRVTKGDVLEALSTPAAPAPAPAKAPALAQAQ